MTGARRSPSSRAAARSSARSRCAPAARVEDALERLGHERRRASTSARDLVERLRERAARRRVRRAARRATARTAPSRSCSRSLGIPYTGSGPARLHALHATRCSPSTCCATPASRRRTSSPSARPRSRSSAPREALPAIEERLGFPLVVKPAAPGLGAGHQVRAHAADEVPAALVAAFSLRRRRSCSSATSTGRDLAVSVLEATAEALPVVEAVPREEDFYDFEARYEIGRTTLRLPGGAADAARRPRAQELARRTSTSCSAATASRAST